MRRRHIALGLAGMLGIGGIADAQEKKKYTFEDYIETIIKVESGGNPREERYEPRLDDWSYGLGQILTKTAKRAEARYPELPRLGETPDEIRDSLWDASINRKYTEAIFREDLDFYNDQFIAIAAYNGGHMTPRNARSQQQLNDLYGSKLAVDGVIGRCSKEVVEKFQEEYKLEVDGIIGPITHGKLQEVWKAKFPKRENPFAIVPLDSSASYHVQKF